MNSLELGKLKSEIEANKAKAYKYRGSGGGSDNQMITNSLPGQLRQLSVGKMIDHNKGGKGSSIPINNREADIWSDYIGRGGMNAFDAHYANASQEDRNTGWGRYDLTSAEKVAPKEYVNIVNPNTGKAEPMIKALASWDSGSAPDNIMDYMENANNMREVDVSYTDRDGDTHTREVVQGYVYIPIGKEIRSKQYMAGFNKSFGVNTRQHGLPTSITNEMQRENTYQGIDNRVNKMREEGYSEEDIKTYMNTRYGI